MSKTTDVTTTVRPFFRVFARRSSHGFMFVSSSVHNEMPEHSPHGTDPNRHRPSWPSYRPFFFGKTSHCWINGPPCSVAWLGMVRPWVISRAFVALHGFYEPFETRSRKSSSRLLIVHHVTKMLRARRNEHPTWRQKSKKWIEEWPSRKSTAENEGAQFEFLGKTRRYRPIYRWVSMSRKRITHIS